MIKAALLLIPLHSILAQLDVLFDEQGALSFYVFNICAAMINIGLIANWANTEGDSNNPWPKSSVLESTSLLGAFFIAAAHPYLYFTSIDGGSWVPTVAYQAASLDWMHLPQSSAQWAQLLYGLSTVSILTSAAHVALRGVLAFAQNNTETQQEAQTENRDWEPTIVSMQREMKSLQNRITKIENSTPTGETRITDWKSRKLDSLDTFGKILDNPKD